MSVVATQDGNVTVYSDGSNPVYALVEGATKTVQKAHPNACRLGMACRCRPPVTEEVTTYTMHRVVPAEMAHDPSVLVQAIAFKDDTIHISIAGKVFETWEEAADFAVDSIRAAQALRELKGRLFHDVPTTVAAPDMAKPQQVLVLEELVVAR